MLKARCETYRKNELAGIVPCTRGWFKKSSPSKELVLVIHKTMTADAGKIILRRC